MFDFLRPNKKKQETELVTSIIMPDEESNEPPASPKKPSPKKSLKKIDNPDHLGQNIRQDFNH